MPSAATISAVIASWVSVPQVSRSPKRLSHNRSNSPITVNRCPAARSSARAAPRHPCHRLLEHPFDYDGGVGQEVSVAKLFADRDRLPRALTNRFEHLLFVF